MIRRLMLVGGVKWIRPARSRVKVATLLGFALALACACALPGASGSPKVDTDQLLHGARTSFKQALSYHVMVSFTLSGKHYQADMDVHRPDLQGTEQIDSTHVDFVLSGGAFYRRGHDFFQQVSGDRVAKLVGNNWVKASDAQLAADFQKLIDPSALDDLQGHHPGVKTGGSSSLHGYATQRLVEGGHTLYVASKAPNYLVRVEDPQGRYLIDGVSDLVIEFYDYGAPVTVATPSPTVDLNDPATLPALFIATGIDSESCDRSGCTLKATIRNDGGPGTSTADFTLEASGTVIDKCTVQIAASPYKGSQQISCRLNSPAWTSWVDAHPGGSYQFRVTPSNPAYS